MSVLLPFGSKALNDSDKMSLQNAIYVSLKETFSPQLIKRYGKFLLKGSLKIKG